MIKWIAIFTLILLTLKYQIIGAGGGNTRGVKFFPSNINKGIGIIGNWQGGAGAGRIEKMKIFWIVMGGKAGIILG